MPLGTNVQYMSGVADLAMSRRFYETCGFRLLDSADDPHPWAQLTDGQITVGLHQDGMQYRGLAYFGEGMAARALSLETSGVLMPLKRERPEGFFQATFVVDERLPVSLIEFANAQPPTPPTPNPMLGGFGELALAVDNLTNALIAWTRLDFEVRFHQAEGAHRWAIIDDGLIQLGLHETTEFRGPALTYFAPDMAARLERLTRAGIALTLPMADEEGVVRNAIVEAPDGQDWFLFEGDVANNPQ